jgi:hypothetical protein
MKSILVILVYDTMILLHPTYITFHKYEYMYLVLKCVYIHTFVFVKGNMDRREYYFLKFELSSFGINFYMFAISQKILENVNT